MLRILAGFVLFAWCAVLGAAPAFSVNATQSCLNDGTQTNDANAHTSSQGINEVAHAPNAPAGTPDAQANAGFGTLSLFVEAFGTGQPRTPVSEPSDVLCSSSAGAAAHDQITVMVPTSLTDPTATGTATVYVEVNGIAGASSDPSGSVYAAASVTWNMSLGGAGRGGTYDVVSLGGNDTTHLTGDPPLGLFSFPVTVNFNGVVPLDLSAGVSAATYDYGALSGFFLGGSAHSQANYIHTFTFLGIGSVVDRNGTPVEFSAIGESGHDYRFVPDPPIAVSEPPSVALGGVGVLIALLARRPRPSRAARSR